MVTAWTKTPPSEPGWYWWRAHKKQVSAWPCLISPRLVRLWCEPSRAHGRTITAKRRRARGEWWPVRIEPPKEQL